MEIAMPCLLCKIQCSHNAKVPKRPVPKRRRTRRLWRNLTPIERFELMFYAVSKEPHYSNLLLEREEDLLIYQKNHFQDPDEIGLGAISLKLPETPTN